MSRASHHRLLVGLAMPPARVRAWLAALDSTVLPRAEHADPASTWMTVHFIGDVAVRDVDETLESVDRAMQGVRGFRLTPSRIASLPKDDAARQVAVQFDLPSGLRELKDRLVRRLARGRRKGADEFQPRVTLARLAQPTEELDISLELSPDPMAVDEVYCVRSVLTPGAYENRVVETFTLAS